MGAICLIFVTSLVLALDKIPENKINQTEIIPTNVTNNFIIPNVGGEKPVWKIIKQDYFSKNLKFAFIQINDTAWNLTWIVKEEFKNKIKSYKEKKSPKDKEDYLKEMLKKISKDKNISESKKIKDFKKLDKYPLNVSTKIKTNIKYIDWNKGNGSLIIEFPEGFKLGEQIKLGFGTFIAETDYAVGVTMYSQQQKMVQDSNGNLYIYFSDDNSTGQDVIWETNSTDNGLNWSTPIQIPNSEHFNYISAVILSNDDKYISVCTNFDKCGYLKHNSSGWSRNDTIFGMTWDFTKMYPISMAVDSNDNIHIAYTDDFYGFTDFDIFYKMLNTTSGNWSETEWVSNFSDYSSDNCNYASIDIKGDTIYIQFENANGNIYENSKTIGGSWKSGLSLWMNTKGEGISPLQIQNTSNYFELRNNYIYKNEVNTNIETDGARGDYSVGKNNEDIFIYTFVKNNNLYYKLYNSSSNKWGNERDLYVNNSHNISYPVVRYSQFPSTNYVTTQFDVLYTVHNGTSHNLHYSSISLINSSFDVINPTIEFVEKTTESGNYSQNWISANVTASDTYFDSLTIYLYNSTSLIQSNTTTNTNLFVNFTGLSDEIYYLNASANDTAENINQTETRIIIIDKTKPRITINSPTTGSTLSNKTITINLTATDINLNYTNISITNSTGSIVNSTTNKTNGTYSIVLSVSADGVYNISATSYDNAGNSNTSIIRNVTIDTTPPTISGILPVANTTYEYSTSEVTFSLNTNEKAICRYNSINTDYSGMSALENTNSTIHNQTISTSPGVDYTYYIRCQDLSGNANNESETVSWSVKTKPNTGGSGSPIISICGNGICEKGENASNCRVDCGKILFSVYPKYYKSNVLAGKNLTCPFLEKDGLCIFKIQNVMNDSISVDIYSELDSQAEKLLEVELSADGKTWVKKIEGYILPPKTQHLIFFRIYMHPETAYGQEFNFPIVVEAGKYKKGVMFFLRCGTMDLGTRFLTWMFSSYTFPNGVKVCCWQVVLFFIFISIFLKKYIEYIKFMNALKNLKGKGIL